MRLVVASLLLTLLPAGAAEAAVDGCDDVVVDRTGLVDVAAVRRAALQVQDHAAEIRVRVYESVPDGDLDAQERADRAACPSWRKPNGQRRDNLIVLSLSTGDRKVGLYYGSVWTPDLRRRWTAIQSQAMSPSFKRGEWTEGLVGGLRATARAIDPMRHPLGDGDGNTQPVPVFDHSDDGGGPSEGAFGLFALVALAVGGLAFLARGGGSGPGDGPGGGGGGLGGGSRFRSGAAGFFAGSLWGSGSSDSSGGLGGGGGGLGGGGGGGHHGGGGGGGGHHGGGGGGHHGGGGGGSSSF